MSAGKSILIYERPKYRKTSAFLAAFPNALYIGRPSSLQEVALSEYGYEPSVPDASFRTLRDVREAVNVWAVDGTLKQFDAVVIDDWSLMSRASMIDWEREAEARAAARSKKEGREVGVSGFEIFGEYEDTQSDILSKCVNAGVHFGVVAHVREPKDGCPGFPDVPSRNQGKNLPAWFDIVARVRESKEWGDPSMPYELYAVDKDKNWVTNDRTGVIRPTAPLNIREILRARRIPIILSRLAGLEWQDEYADEVAEEIVGGLDIKDVVAARFPGGIPDPPASNEEAHTRWALQDGIARGYLRVRSAKRLAASVVK